MDLVPWIIRAVLIIVAIILAIMILRGKKEGKYQSYSFRFFIIGVTTFLIGIILLILSFMTDLSFDYDSFLIAAGAICIIIGLVIRNIWEKNHRGKGDG